MQWYYSQSGSQHGPVSREELQAKIEAGEVGRHEKVWQEGMDNWISLGEAGEFDLTNAPAAVETGGSSFATTATAPAPANNTPATGPQAAQGLGIASMVLGILGVICGLSCCLWFMAPIFGIAAVVTGHLQKNKLKAVGSSEGGGFVLTGLITGYIAIAIGVVFIILAIIGQTPQVQNFIEEQGAAKLEQRLEEELRAGEETPFEAQPSAEEAGPEMEPEPRPDAGQATP